MKYRMEEIAIPDDVSNESRALLLLQAAGLIGLDAEKGLLPTVNDITSNPKSLKFTVLAANQTARAMTDVDASVVNNDMAADAGLVPTEDAIFLEPVADSSKPYYNATSLLEKMNRKILISKSSLITIKLLKSKKS